MIIRDALNGVHDLFVESAPFIYFVEESPHYVAVMREVFKTVQTNNLNITTSTITLTEVLTKPLLAGDSHLTQAYRHMLLNTRNIQTIAIDNLIADLAAQLRATYRLKTPDALQIATAIHTNCDAFLTNDSQLARDTEIQVLLIDDLELSLPLSE